MEWSLETTTEEGEELKVWCKKGGRGAQLNDLLNFDQSMGGWRRASGKTKVAKAN